jgi:hypothetical protein
MDKPGVKNQLSDRWGVLQPVHGHYTEGKHLVL